MTDPFTSKTVIGWSEYICFPDWGIARVHAKVDTGARTSALHVENLKRLKGDRVQFEVVLSRRSVTRRAVIKAPVLRWGRVRSSTGVYRTRCFVRALIRLGPVEKEIELSLISREKMLFRMLIGRTALEKDFVVDVGRRRALGTLRVRSRAERKEDKT
jgi:hypothetical protein